MKHNRKGFTIVELVIVIAVIAILAAVLIPTFSSLIKKANLSSDMQAVREINTALAADQALNGVPKNTDVAMAVIQAAGYDVGSYKPLSEGFEIYWVDTVNRVVLVQTLKNDAGKVTDWKVVYPEDYTTLTNDGSWHVFNESVVIAMSFNLNVNSNDINWSGSNITATTDNQAVSSIIASQVASGSTIKYSTNVISGSSASAQLAVTFAQATSNGVVTISNPIYTVTTPANYASLNAESKLAIDKAAGDFIYTLGVQINEGMIKDSNGKATTDVDIVIPASNDLSNHVWTPIRAFNGTFTSETPATISNLTLDSGVSYLKSAQFDGSKSEVKVSSKYNVYGFFDVVEQGEISNITFKNISIITPGTDYEATLQNTGSSNANVFGVVGSIAPNLKAEEGKVPATNVTISNVHIDGGTIEGLGRVGGIVGYIGGSSMGSLQGKYYIQEGSKIVIKDCSVKGVNFTSGKTSTAYGSLGGIVSYLCRINGLDLDIMNCEVSGCTMTGSMVGSLIGWFNDDGLNDGIKPHDLDTTNDFDCQVTNCVVKNNTIIYNNYAGANYGIGVFVGSTTKDQTFENYLKIDDATIKGATNNTLKTITGTYDPTGRRGDIYTAN